MIGDIFWNSELMDPVDLWNILNCGIPGIGDSVDWKSYENRLRTWSQITNIDKSKQAICLYLQMPVNENEISSYMSLDMLQAENGMDMLLRLLKWRFSYHELKERLSLKKPELLEKGAWRWQKACLESGLEDEDLEQKPEERCDISVGVSLKNENAASSEKVDYVARSSNESDIDLRQELYFKYEEACEAIENSIVYNEVELNETCKDGYWSNLVNKGYDCINCQVQHGNVDNEENVVYFSRKNLEQEDVKVVNSSDWITKVNSSDIKSKVKSSEKNKKVKSVQVKSSYVNSSRVKSGGKNKKVKNVQAKNTVSSGDFDRFTCKCENCVAEGEELDESLDCSDWTEKWLEMCDKSIDYSKVFSIRNMKDEKDKGTEGTKSKKEYDVITKYSNKILWCCDLNFATLQLYYNYITMLSKKGNIVVESRGNKLFRAFLLTNSLTQVMSLKMFDTNKVGVTGIPFLFSKEIIENQNMVLDLSINFEKTVGSLIHWQQVDYSHYMQFFIESSEVIETNSGLMFEDKSSNHHRNDLYEPSGSGRSETKCKKSGGLDFSNLYGSALVCLADSEKLYSLSKLQYQSKSKGLFNLITDVILWIFKYSYIFEDISRDFSVFHQCIIVYKCYRVFPLGYYLHEVLIFDLKHIKAEYIFYLIDCIKTFTKFVIIKMSKSSIVFKSLNDFVISYGHKTIFSDSRVDFIFQQVHDFYVIKLTIASGALFLGGICEGVVHVTDIILTTLVYICPIEKFDVLLVWANMVLRNPQISEGLHQFVLGWNLRVLNCIYSKLQFLEVCNNSKAFARKMYNFNKAVNAYIQSALTKMEMNYRHYFGKCNLKYCKEQEVAKWLSLALVVFQIIKIICYWIEFYIIEAEKKDNKISSFNKSRGKPCGFIKKVLRCLKYIQKLVEMQENQTQITGYRSGKVNKKNTSSTGLKDVSNYKLVVQCDICYKGSHIEYANMVKEDNEYQDLTVMLICDEQVKICDNVECKFLKDKNKALIEELYSVTCKNKTLEIELEKEKLKGKHLEFKVERFKSILKIIECGSTVSKVVSYKAGKVRKEKKKGVLEKTSQYKGVSRDEIARVGKRISWKEIEPHCIFAKNVIRNQVVKSASSCNMINSNEGKYKKKKTKIKVKFKKTKIKVKFKKTKIKVKSKKTEIKLKSSKKKIVKRIWIKKPWRNKRSSVKRINLYLC